MTPIRILNPDEAHIGDVIECTIRYQVVSSPETGERLIVEDPVIGKQWTIVASRFLEDPAYRAIAKTVGVGNAGKVIEDLRRAGFTVSENTETTA